MFIIFFVLIVTCLATVLIFGIFAHTYISNPLYRAKNRPQPVARADVV